MSQVAAQPGWLHTRSGTWIWIPVLLLAGLGLRFSGLNFMSMDIQDFLLDWYDRLARDGFVALRESFTNYTPPYLYLLFLATRTIDFLPKVPAIKLISIGFDLLNVFLIYKILNLKYPRGLTAGLGAASFFLLPTVWLNSGYWGQADGIYTCFLLACLFCLLQDRPFTAMIFLGVAFAFKIQTIFLGPFILLLLIRKRIPWYAPGLVPVVYVLMIIPAALTGRSLMDLLTVYVVQTDFYRTLSDHAPNPYLFIPNTLYNPGVVVGVALTALIVLVWVITYARKIEEFTPSTLMLCALVSAAMMPFFLPKMHDRYFYLAEVLAFLVAFYIPRLWTIALAYQLVSVPVYLVALRASVVPVNPALAGSILILAAFLNIALMSYLFWKQWKLTNDITESAQPV